MYHQHHQLKFIHWNHPCFGRTSSYYTRTPNYFAIIPTSAWISHSVFHLKPHNGGIHCHPLWLVVLIDHFISMHVDALGQYCNPLHWFYYNCMHESQIFCFRCSCHLFVATCNVLVVCLIYICVCVLSHMQGRMAVADYPEVKP